LKGKGTNGQKLFVKNQTEHKRTGRKRILTKQKHSRTKIKRIENNRK
jgi:hypothetical protein